MARRFYKMTGSGNDFVFLDGREHDLADWPAARIQEVCDRRRGVGADGVVHLAATDAGAVRMIYWNADGSRAEMCGNAALCSARLVARLGLADPDRIALDTDSGRLETRVVGAEWGAELKFPEVAMPAPIDLPLGPGEEAAFQGTVGVPHTILLVRNLAEVDVIARGQAIRHDPRFAPAGTNVNFVARLQGAEAPWSLRTYERGVEAETLACGTGTIAGALALVAANLAELPAMIRSSSGLIYSISAVIDGRTAREIWLRGEGRLVFEGRLESNSREV